MAATARESPAMIARRIVIIAPSGRGAAEKNAVPGAIGALSAPPSRVNSRHFPGFERLVKAQGAKAGLRKKMPKSAAIQGAAWHFCIIPPWIWPEIAESIDCGARE